MFKLLKANLFRLKKDNVFWVFILISIGVALFTIFQASDTSLSFDIPLDSLIVIHFDSFGFFMAFFVSLFVGKEYGEGAIRNKIITGHKKIDIYLADLVSCILVNIIVVLIYMSIVFVIGNFMFGSLQMPLGKYPILILKMIMVIVLYCSIYNFITLLCSSMEISLIICITFFAIIFFSGNVISPILYAKPYFPVTFIDENGEIHVEYSEINPNYPSETKRKIAKVVYCILPMGLENEIANEYSEELGLVEKTDIYVPLYYPIITIGIINLVGIELFKKKELK